MRRLLSVSLLALSLAMASSVHAEEWFRLNISPTIYFGGHDTEDGNGEPPTGGVNDNISISIDAQVNGRVYGNLAVPVLVSGIDETYAVSVVGLPGAMWQADSQTYGAGTLAWVSASPGTYHPTVEVRDVGGALVASADIEIVIHPQLTASVPQSVYEVEVGDELIIAPGVQNAIGDVRWSATPSLPSWAMSVDDTTGGILVDTVMPRTIVDIVLTATDQADWATASTLPFSVTVKASCDVWTAHAVPEANPWNSVTYGNGLFVAVANTGTNRVMTSPDGVAWTARAAAEANPWYSATYGNGKFVAVAATGTNRVMTSPDGITWTATAAAAANNWYSVTYGNGLFVAVAYSGTNRVMTSPDGITWTARTTPVANPWFSVTYGNGLFVAVAGGTNQVMTSPDGITWTARTAAVANDWRSVTYGNGLFVAVANTGTNRVMTSPDGITWTAQAAADEASTWYSVTYGNDLFVAVASGGTNRVMTSPDGVTWTARAADEANSWVSVTHGNGKFVAVASSGTNRVMTLSECP